MLGKEVYVERKKIRSKYFADVKVTMNPVCLQLININTTQQRRYNGVPQLNTRKEKPERRRKQKPWRQGL